MQEVDEQDDSDRTGSCSVLWEFFLATPKLPPE
jgi:hypothetical protein